MSTLPPSACQISNRYNNLNILFLDTPWAQVIKYLIFYLKRLKLDRGRVTYMRVDIAQAEHDKIFWFALGPVLHVFIIHSLNMYAIFCCMCSTAFCGCPSFLVEGGDTPENATVQLHISSNKPTSAGAGMGTLMVSRGNQMPIFVLYWHKHT